MRPAKRVTAFPTYQTSCASLPPVTGSAQSTLCSAAQAPYSHEKMPALLTTSIASSGRSAIHPAEPVVSAGAAAQRMERMGGDGEPALGMDQLDSLGRRQARRHPVLEIETEEMAVQGADLLADHHVDTEVRPVDRERRGLAGAANLVVVRDGYHVHSTGTGAHDRVRPLGSIAPAGMHVEVRAAARARDPLLSRGRRMNAHPSPECPLIDDGCPVGNVKFP